MEESYALYCNAAVAGAHALSILTVSDLLFSGKSMSADQRERGFFVYTRIKYGYNELTDAFGEWRYGKNGSVSESGEEWI